MAGFFSKASSFLSSQADREAPSHGAKGDDDAETRKPAGSGGYGDLLAGAQALMNSAKPSDESEPVHKDGKAPSSGGYGDLLASAQSFMATAKPVDKVGETDKAPGSGGYGDLLASAESLMGSTKLSSSDGVPVDKKQADLKTTSSGTESGYGDIYASAQVLMGAVKGSREGTAANMGEVAGASANLIGAASHYGNLEKTTYGEYAHKAQTYLQDYQASHGKGASPQEVDKASAGSAEEGSNPPLGRAQEKQEEGSSPPVKNPTRSTDEEE